MKFRKIVMSLLIGALFLPLFILLLMALGLVVGTMGDSNGPVILRALALGLGFFWVIDLVTLLIALALAHLTTPEPSSAHDES